MNAWNKKKLICMFSNLFIFASLPAGTVTIRINNEAKFTGIFDFGEHKTYMFGSERINTIDTKKPTYQNGTFTEGDRIFNIVTNKELPAGKYMVFILPQFPKSGAQYRDTITVPEQGSIIVNYTMTADARVIKD